MFAGSVTNLQAACPVLELDQKDTVGDRGLENLTQARALMRAIERQILDAHELETFSNSIERHRRRREYKHLLVRAMLQDL